MNLMEMLAAYNAAHNVKIEKPVDKPIRKVVGSKTVTENGITTNYEWNQDKNDWQKVGCSVENDAVSEKAEEPTEFKSYADALNYLETQLKADHEGEKIFDTWKKSTKEQYETPQCAILNEEDADELTSLGCGVSLFDDNTFILQDTCNGTPIKDSETELAFDTVYPNGVASVGITDMQLLTVLLYRNRENKAAYDAIKTAMQACMNRG